ncbi:hypothetical protein CsSME_00006863 [Camellia sinensis var. sinensis]
MLVQLLLRRELLNYPSLSLFLFYFISFIFLSLCFLVHFFRILLGITFLKDNVYPSTPPSLLKPSEMVLPRQYLVNTPGAMAEFRRDYYIPDDVHLILVELDTIPWGNPGFVPFTLFSIAETGLRFPVQPFLCEFLRQTNLCPTQLSTNSYRIINGIAELNRRAGLNLGLAELFHQYSIGSNEDGWVYYLRIRRRREKIIKDTPDKDVNDDDFFWVSGNFEDQQSQIPDGRINWNKGEVDLNFLKSQYNYPNLNALRAALRYLNRSWAVLLEFEPTCRHNSKKKTRVTDFLLEASPEPDPSLPEINLIRLTAEQEMAKKRAPVGLRRPWWPSHPINLHHLVQTSVLEFRLPSHALLMKIKPFPHNPLHQAHNRSARTELAPPSGCQSSLFRTVL